MIGIIGGSGIYEIDGLQNARWQTVETPWGPPSDAVLTGVLDGTQMAFLPRHGRGHVQSPSSVNYRANIDALKQLGVREIVALSACGSLREHMVPGDFVLVDQFIDRTFAREKSFFGPGCVGHVSLADPVCARLGDACAAAAASQGVTVHRGGTYLVMEGPQFSTRAESRLYREKWGADVIGMTNMPEAKLAREAEICYAPIAMITDFDSWHPGHAAVDVAQVIATMQGNTGKARGLIAALPGLLPARGGPCTHGCERALDHAIMTAPGARDPALMALLATVAGRVLGDG